MALSHKNQSLKLSDQKMMSLNENNGQRSIPAILARKRKSEAQARNQDQTMEYVFVSNNSSMDFFIDENSENSCSSNNSQSSNKGLFSAPANTNINNSSRLPLSTLQNRHILGSHSNNIHPCETTTTIQSLHSRVAKLGDNSEKSASNKSANRPPAAKKLRMRPSWSQFREFTLSKMAKPVRSETPLPHLNWADKQEMWDLICKKESGMYKRKSSTEILRNHSSLQPRMRTILLDWLIEVCEVYRQHRETFYLAVDFIDRYLSVTKDMPKNRLQLIGVTCLFIGSKIEEIYPPKLSEFAYVTDGACSEEEILKMELVILKTLNWGLSPMTPNAWMRMFMQLSTQEQKQQQQHNVVEFVSPIFSGLPFSEAMQLMDLVTMDMGSLNYSYSVLATSALCLLQDRESALRASGYVWSDIAKCVDWMGPFLQALSEEPALQPGSFTSIGIENQHNIQSHTLELSVLERAQDLSQVRRKQLMSPVPVNTTLIATEVMVTPPELDSDVRYPQHQHLEQHQRLQAAQQLLFSNEKADSGDVPSNSVFLSPRGPIKRNDNDVTMTFPEEKRDMVVRGDIFS